MRKNFAIIRQRFRIGKVWIFVCSWRERITKFFNCDLASITNSNEIVNRVRRIPWYGLPSVIQADNSIIVSVACRRQNLIKVVGVLRVWGNKWFACANTVAGITPLPYLVCMRNTSGYCESKGRYDCAEAANFCAFHLSWFFGFLAASKRKYPFILLGTKFLTPSHSYSCWSLLSIWYSTRQ